MYEMPKRKGQRAIGCEDCGEVFKVTRHESDIPAECRPFVGMVVAVWDGYELRWQWAGEELPWEW